MSIKGFKSQQALAKKLSGFTEDESIDQARYATLQEMPGRRHAVDVVIHGAYEITAVPLTVGAGSNIRVLNITAHGASKNDLIRMVDGTEFSVLSTPDADTIITSVELDSSPIGKTIRIYRYITPAYNNDGALNVSVSPTPIQYNRKSAGTTIPTYVLEDLDTPAASKPMPVAIHSIDGAGITVNAGDLSVSTSHVNDSMSIGDGTRLVGTTVSNELKVNDASTNTALGLANTSLDSIKTLITATNTKLSDKTQFTQLTNGTNEPTLKQVQTQVASTDYGFVTQSVLHAFSTAGGGAFVDVKANPSGALTVDATVSSSALPTGASTEATQLLVKAKTDNLDVLLSTRNAEATQALIKAKTDNLDVALSTVAKDVTLLASNTLIGAVTETAPVSDTASSGLNGRLQRIAQNISAMIIQLPASLGIKTAAASLSIAPASDAVFGVKTRPLTNSFAELPTLSTVQTFTAPANAIGGKIQALSDNTANIRYAQGGTATTTSGIRLEPGRSEDFNGGSNISVISESGTNAVSVNWTIQA